MAKMKKVLAIAMAAAMGMSMLAGCGGQGKDDVTEATSQAETSEAATSEEKTEEAASEEAEQEKTEVKAGDVLITMTRTSAIHIQMADRPYSEQRTENCVWI